MTDTPALQIPELQALARPEHVVRIPPGDDVPLTPRVERIVDSAPLRRLSRVSQLGLVGQVYPGAVHHRLEHSLGVYRNALLFLQRLSLDPRFIKLVDPLDAEAFLLVALVHDVGHWPFCHPIEDIGLPGLPEHEHRAREILTSGELKDAIECDWHVPADKLVRLLEGNAETDSERMICSLLSGPLDIDKLDYLQRDSLHAGVPYGRNFDAQRLIGSLCVHPDEPRVAISDKGRTAAEMMVFARYVMFSEVYWHHTVRSATAMLQRAVWLLQSRLDLMAMCNHDDAAWIRALRSLAQGSIAEPLVEGLFGKRRRLWKRGAEFNVLDQPELHQTLARRPYGWLVDCSERLAKRIGAAIGQSLSAADVIIDAPPVKLEVDIAVNVVGRQGVVRGLGEVSPVVKSLAQNQFDRQVKRVRVFVTSEVRERLAGVLPVEWLVDSL